MFRVITNITFQQQPTDAFPGRNRVLIYNLAHKYNTESTWKNLTDTGEIVLPRNVYIKDKTGRRLTLGGTNINLGGFEATEPIFLRGDKVTIQWGYVYQDQRGNEVSPTVTIFEGYISQVTSKKPFVLQIENNMWKLKQVQASGGKGGYFADSKYSVEGMLREMIKNAGLPFTVNPTTSTSIGNFLVQQETIAEVLARLRRDFNLEAYFRGNELRIGSFPYLPADVAQPVPKFRFQYNIIEDDLEYQRKDDIVLSAVASNTIEEFTGNTTRDGRKKTRKKRLEVLVTFSKGSDKPTIYEVERGKEPPPNVGGERRSFKFLTAKTHKELAALAVEQLKKYYYTGMRGTFKTFGLPYVKHGDHVDLIDPLLPERNGRYMVKGVKYEGGIDGLRQTIELDYLVGNLDANGKFIGR